MNSGLDENPVGPNDHIPRFGWGSVEGPFDAVGSICSFPVKDENRSLTLAVPSRVSSGRARADRHEKPTRAELGGLRFRPSRALVFLSEERKGGRP